MPIRNDFGSIHIVQRILGYIMSNPAVIMLASLNGRKNTFKRFQIEDNIGESIHLHIDYIRVDLSVNDFLDFSGMIRKSLAELNLFHGYDINDFDSRFLYECGNLLYGLSKISIEDVSLSDLRFIVREKVYNDLMLYSVVSVDKTPAFRYLNGDKKDFVTYNQFNYLGISNKDRLLNLLNSIKDNNYPHKEKYVILFNGQNIVRDGQHRAAVLAHLYGINAHIKVMMFHFDDNRHIFKKNTDNFKSLAKWISKKVRSRLRAVLIS